MSGVSPEDLAAVGSMEELAACMQKLREHQGSPSLRELEQWGLNQNRPLPRSTVSDALKARRPPRIQLLENYLTALLVQDQKSWLEALERVYAAQPRPARPQGVVSERGTVSADRFFVERDDPDEIYRLIEGVREEVWLWGTTLSMHIPYLQPAIRRAIANGRNVKILLIKSGGAAMAMSALRAGPDGLGVAEQEEQLRANLAILERLGEDSRLAVRQIDYLAPYTLYAYDPGLDDGKMLLRIGSFHGRHHLRPTFEIKRSREEDWFYYFYEQFVSVWNAAEPAGAG
jgi:hypothetical protein